MLPEPGVASAMSQAMRRSSSLPQRRLAQVGMRGQEAVEVALRELDQIGGEDRRHGRRARRLGEERRLAEEVAGHEVREHDLLVARLLGDLHHAVADQIERVAGSPSLEDDGVLAERLHDRRWSTSSPSSASGMPGKR